MEEEQRNAIDIAIFEGRVLVALMAVRDATGCSIPAAIDVIAARHDLLRAACPDHFVVSREDWGRSFNS